MRREAASGLMRSLARAAIAVLSLLGLASLVAGACALWILQPTLKDPRVSSTEVRALKAGLKAPADLATPQQLYLDLLKRVLTRYQFAEIYEPLQEAGRYPTNKFVYQTVRDLLAQRGFELVHVMPFDPELRESGQDTPLDAETMVGLKRLDNLQFCVEEVLRRNVPGDLIECGAWRGGSCILMRAVLKAYGNTDRTVWVADSFEGLPKFDQETYAEDAKIWEGGEMAVSIEEVKQNFERYGLLDSQVRFLKGFFVDTLPDAPVQHLSVLRLDADLYESTTQALDYLYPKVSPGGYVIVDDYNLPAAKQAIHDYRDRHKIVDEIIPIDAHGVYWEKSE